MMPSIRTKLVLLALVTTSSLALAKDFDLKDLPQAKNPTFDLSDSKGSNYDSLVRKSIAPKMQALVASTMHPREITDDGGRKKTIWSANKDNETVLNEGGGVSVKLSKNNYNVHINFPNQAEGGRSYGWTSGEVGDWSDAMDLSFLFKTTAGDTIEELENFYRVLIGILGSNDADGLEKLSNPNQRAATNFLAIYTAEKYRSIVPNPHHGWDDALFQTQLLAAFHSGQSTFTKFYVGKFSDMSKEQGAGVYNRGTPGTLFNKAKDKKAEMDDYWQFSANPTSRQSGINITRRDFEKMGIAITAYEKTVGKNANLAKLIKIVGDKGSTNVIAAISDYYVGGGDPAQTKAMQDAVAGFMVDVHNDANKITEWIQSGACDVFLGADSAPPTKAPRAPKTPKKASGE